MDFSTGFNIDISKLTGVDKPIVLLLPNAADYDGAECTIWYAHVCTRVPHEHPRIGIINNSTFLNLEFEGNSARKFVPEAYEKIKLSALPYRGMNNESFEILWHVDTPEFVTAVE